MAFFNRSKAIKQRPVCECGVSGSIEAHALLSWNEQIQDWQISEVFERGNCSSCGNTDAKLTMQNY